MQLKINEVQLPEKIDFNYEELKQELQERIAHYETMVYTEEQIQEAKKDKANLNKLKTALNDERIRREREYMQPFNDFKAKVNEIISIIDKPVAVIDRQVKEFEEKRKEAKKEAIKEYWADLLQANKVPAAMTLNMIFSEKWLNASVSMKSIQDNINTAIEKFAMEITTLSNLPEFSFEAQQMYISTLDVSKALNEAHRLSEMAKEKAAYEAEMKKRAEEQARLAAEAEAKKKFVAPGVEEKPGEAFSPTAMNPPVVENPATWVSFKALLTVAQARELKQFFDDRCIDFQPI